MDCCRHTAGLNQIFNEKQARDSARRYRRSGLEPAARRFVAAASRAGVDGATLLEIGGGIGDLTIELIRHHGAASATNVEASEGYLPTAQALSRDYGLADKITNMVGDVAQNGDGLPEADVVMMHRVICCYPDMPRLIAAAARRAKRRLIVSYPSGAWYMRLFEKAANLGLFVIRSGYRLYIHRPADIIAAAQSHGFTKAAQTTSFPWQIVTFARPA